MANETEWTKEPWVNYGDHELVELYLVELNSNDYTRAVICVNACSGLSESQIKEALKDYKEKCDE